MTTPTPETPSLETREPTLDDVKAMIRSAEIHEPSNAPNAARLYWKTAARSGVQIAERFERENAELVADRDKWSQRAIDEQAEHHKTLDAAEKAAEHIELQNVAIRGASEAIANLQAQLADERKHGDDLVYVLKNAEAFLAATGRSMPAIAERIQRHTERRKP